MQKALFTFQEHLSETFYIILTTDRLQHFINNALSPGKDNSYKPNRGHGHGSDIQKKVNKQTYNYYFEMFYLNRTPIHCFIRDTNYLI